MKRIGTIALAGLAAVILMAGAVALYLHTYEPDRVRFPMRGIDVSHHQGVIDWPAVARDDVAFAYLKASEGGDFRDTRFEQNIAEADDAGLPVGVYHFFTFCRPGADQAVNFLDAIEGKPLSLPAAVDLEFVGNCEQRPTREEMAEEVSTFVDAVERELGQAVIYYVTSEFLDAYGEGLPPRRLWRRSVFREPATDDWLIWQYHPAGRVAGIDGDVDLNVLAGSLETLMTPLHRP